MKRINVKTALVIVSLLCTQACTQTPITSTSSKIIPETPKTSQKEEIKYDETKYRPIIDILNKIYGKEQYLYNKNHASTKYFFEFVPISLFPLFCTNEALNKNGAVIYIYQGNYSALKTIDGMDYDHVKIGVVSYVKSKSCPSIKKYKLYSFFLNTATELWEEENKAVLTTLVLTDSSQCLYGCKNTE